MSILEERERAFETKYAHEQEVQFRTVAQRNRLLGQWVSRLIGLPDSEAEDYTKSLVERSVERPDLQSLIAQVSNDLETRGHDLPRRALQQKVDELTEVARDQVFHGGVI